jgi:hypothetical protein
MTSLNAFIRSTLDDLVEKRLWPVAAALLLALIAIPLLLRSPAEEHAAPAPAGATPAVGSGGSLAAFQPVVTTQGKKSSEIRKDLEGFRSKDPFKPQNIGGGGGEGGGGSVQVQGTDTATTGAGGAGGGSVTPDSTSGSAPAGGDSSTGSGGGTTKPQTFYYTYAAEVRFGKEGNLDRKTLQQFRSLPSTQDPVLVFMGVKQDGETAIFLQSSGATSTGEGNCEPDDTCTFLYMKKGDEQRIEAVTENGDVVTYKLVLLDIDVKRTDGPEKAKSSSRRAHSSHKAHTRHKAHSSRKAHSRRKAERAERRAKRARGFQAIGF